MCVFLGGGGGGGGRRSGCQLEPSYHDVTYTVNMLWISCVCVCVLGGGGGGWRGREGGEVHELTFHEDS